MKPVNTPWESWYHDGTKFVPGTADAINLHATSGKPLAPVTSAHSQGCQTVYWDDYVDFGKAVGFLDKDKEYTTEKDVTTSLGVYMHDLVKTKLSTPSLYPEEIKYILDRSYDEQNSHYKKQLETLINASVAYNNFAKANKKYINGIFYPIE